MCNLIFLKNTYHKIKSQCLDITQIGHSERKGSGFIFFNFNLKNKQLKIH